MIGVAQALNKVGGLFSKNDQTLLEGIAAQSVPALQSSQTVERMRKARAQELAFLDIVADITSQIDLDQLLQPGDDGGKSNVRGGAFDAVSP